MLNSFKDYLKGDVTHDWVKTSKNKYNAYIMIDGKEIYVPKGTDHRWGPGVTNVQSTSI